MSSTTASCAPPWSASPRRLRSKPRPRRPGRAPTRRHGVRHKSDRALCGRERRLPAGGRSEKLSCRIVRLMAPARAAARGDRIAVDAAVRAAVIVADIAALGAEAAGPIALGRGFDLVSRHGREALGIDAARLADALALELRLGA